MVFGRLWMMNTKDSLIESEKYQQMGLDSFHAELSNPISFCVCCQCFKLQ